MRKLLVIFAFFCVKINSQVLNVFPDDFVLEHKSGTILNVFGNYATPYEWDVNAVKFLDSAGVTGYESRYKLNEFVKDLKSINSIQANFVDFDTLSVSVLKGVYPFIDSTAESHKWNLMNPQNTDAAYRLTFVGAPTHDYNELVLNGTSQYANSHYNLNGITAMSHGVWLKNNTWPSGTSIYCLGSASLTNNSKRVSLMISNNAGSVGIYSDYFKLTEGNGRVYSSGIQDINGLLSASITTGSNNHYIYRNGLRIARSTEVNYGSGPNLDLYIGAQNRQDIVNNYTNNTIKFAYIGASIDSAAMELFYVAINKYLNSDTTIDYFDLSAPFENLNIVIDGDSRSRNNVDLPTSYPVILSGASFLNLNETSTLTNYAVGGQTSAQCLSNISDHLLDSYDETKINILLLEIGINDFQPNLDYSTINNIKKIVDTANILNYRIYVMTITPSKVLGQTEEYYETKYANLLILNNLIRNLDEIYNCKIIDLFADPAFNYYDAPEDLTYYQADQVHHSVVGYTIWSQLIYNFLTGN